MGNGASVGYCGLVEASIGLQSPDFLGTIWRGEDQGLLDGRMMPRSSMCWNSLFAECKRSGARRLALAAMG